MPSKKICSRCGKEIYELGFYSLILTPILIKLFGSKRDISQKDIKDNLFLLSEQDWSIIEKYCPCDDDHSASKTANHADHVRELITNLDDEWAPNHPIRTKLDQHT